MATRAERTRERATRPARVAPADRERRPETQPLDYDVVVIGGGPAGLAAAAFCGRKKLRTAVFEGETWGGILTRWCPDKRIDNYPGVRPGVLAGELGGLLAEDARRAGADLFEGQVEEIDGDREVRAGSLRTRGKVLILASGSTAAEAGIPGEKELASRDGGIHYIMKDPGLFREKRVVVIGGGDTALSHVQRLCGTASAVTLVHRAAELRGSPGLAAEALRPATVKVLLHCRVEAFLGRRAVEGVRLRNEETGEAFECPAEAVLMAVGTRPNTALFRDMEVALDGKGQVVTDLWQRTNVPGVLAVGDVSSHLKMIITAVGQAAVAAQQAYTEVRSPYWK